jgi:GAF domain-containing protein
MEPVPETEAALAEYLEPDDDDLRELLRDRARVARSIVPEIVGMSLTLVRDQLTFTLVASDLQAAAVDATQYLDGGPCVRDQQDRAVRQVEIEQALDEDYWTMFARASSAAGIKSTLSLAVMDEGQVVGGVNLYAATGDAFTGRHETLADALGATAMGAVKDADMSFLTRELANEAPVRLRERQEVETAVGILAGRYRETIDEARRRLAHSAARARLSDVAVARVVISLLTT